MEVYHPSKDGKVYGGNEMIGNASSGAVLSGRSYAAQSVMLAAAQRWPPKVYIKCSEAGPKLDWADV